ncbi:MAG: response regulator [Gemmatimonadales bacterium]|nr:MAG: response regulator [Gemmatimonadales bacterium]
MQDGMSTERETTTERTLVRWGLALALGVAALILNQWTFPILTRETPNFIFGGIPVLVSFLALGPAPGILTALISLLAFPIQDFWAAHPAAAAGLLIYVIEGLAVYYLYRRTRSIPLAAALFWFGGGWILTVLNYQVWMGLSFGYTALFVVKQLLNALMVALGAELILSRPIRRWFQRMTGGSVPPYPLAEYAFRRTVLLTLIPLTFLGLLHARSQYEAVIRDIGDENMRLAWETVRDVDDYIRERHQTLADLARALEIDPAGVNSGGHLQAFLNLYPESYLIARTDPTGRVIEARPITSAAGDTLVGLDVSARDYFQATRDGQSMVHGRLILGDLEIRDTGAIEPAVIMTHPLAAADGSFGGALIASIDPAFAALELNIMAGTDPADPIVRNRVTLLDAEGILIGSVVPGRDPGLSIEAIVRGPQDSELEPFPLTSLAHPTTFSYFPPPSGSLESNLALDLTFASFHPVLRSGWGVLVDTPSTVLYARILPVTFQILALVGGVLLVLVVIVRAFARGVALPIRAAADTARRITAGELDPDVVSSQLATSPLLEPRELHASLEGMRAALARKDELTRARQEELEAQLLQAQKMEAVGLLAGGIAHDFNNMLTPIMGLSDLGREEAESEDVRDYFREIQSASARAREIVHQLLAFSRKQVLSMNALDLGDELRRSHGLLRSLLRENIELEIEIEEGAHPVLADSTQLQQILVNLAVNAQDAMPDGGRLRIALERVETGPIDLAEESLDGAPVVKLAVSDTGDGIAGEHLPHIFDPFFTTKSPGKGTGLGLATVYGIIRQHDGAIRARSRPGAGTTFEIYLPVTRREVQAEGDDRPPAAPESVRGARILLVEDDEAVRRFVLRVLDRAGYAVHVARSAEEALDIAESEGAFDLLLTDVILPGRNGRELYDEMTARQPGLKALFMSGYSHDVLGDGGLPDGTEFLSKPFELNELMAQVRSVLERRETKV